MSGGRNWTVSEDNQLLHMVEKERVKYIVVAKRLNRTYSAVYSRIRILKRKRGIPILPRLHKPGELEERVRTLCIPDVPDSAVAGILGVSRVMIKNTRHRLGIVATCRQHAKIASPERANISRDAKFLRLYSGVGKSDGEIARIMCVSNGCIQHIRNKYKLPALGVSFTRLKRDDKDESEGTNKDTRPRIYSIDRSMGTW